MVEIFLNGFVPAAGAVTTAFLIIALGIIARRYVLKDPAAWHAVERLTFFIFLPALVINAFIGGVGDDLAIGAYAVVLIGTLGIIILIVWALFKPLTKRGMNKATFSSLFQTSTRWNGFLTLAIAGQALGQEAATIATIGILLLIPSINIANALALSIILFDEPLRPYPILKRLLTNPIVVSALVGIGLLFVEFNPPAIIENTIAITAGAGLPVLLVIIGANLNLSRPSKLTEAWLSPVLKLIVMPLVSLALAKAVGLNTFQTAVCVLIAATPAATNGIVLARAWGGDVPYYANALSLQTLLSAFAMPFWLAFALI